MKRKTKRPRRLILMDKAWKLFSEFIRKRDKYICFTCDKQLEKNTSQAGHFIHGKYTPIYFNEFNIHCQCVNCNYYKNVGIIYLRKIQLKYGIKKADKLIAQKDKVHQWKIKELEALIKKYKGL